MSKFKWYFYRFKKMSLKEIIYRIKIHFTNKKLYRDITNNNIEVVRYNSVKYLDNINVESIKDSIINDANRVFKNEFLIFDEYKKIEMPYKNKYLYDFSNKKEIEKKYFDKIDFRSSNINTKAVWEINKQYFLIPLAIAYKKNNDDKYYEKCIEEIICWINENEAYSTINWCSNLEMALRNMNWIISLSILKDKINKELEKVIVESMIRQVKFIAERLSLYSSANNHLIGELTFILLASYFIDCTESKEWKFISKKLLEEQIDNQFYKDGINKEQSVNYQMHTTELYLISMMVLKLNNDRLNENVDELIKNSLKYIKDISESDGQIFNIGDQDSGNIIKVSSDDNDVLNLLHWGAMYFNDNSLINTKINYFSNKVYLFYGEDYLELLAELDNGKVQENVNRLYDNGGVVLKRGILKDNPYTLHIDYGEIGMYPLYAHAHSDILSFNLNINEKPIFIDTGTFTYKLDNGLREYFRGVTGHNTISVNKENQFDFLGAFIASKSPLSEIVVFDENIVKLKTDAYKRNGCEVSRKFETLNNSIIIEDYLINRRKKSNKIYVYFNLDSDVEIVKNKDNYYMLSIEGVRVKFEIDSKLTVKLLKGVNNGNGDIGGFQSKKYNQIIESYQFVCSIILEEEIKLKYKIEVI